MLEEEFFGLPTIDQHSMLMRRLRMPILTQPEMRITSEILEGSRRPSPVVGEQDF
jgi:hypothetical protein